MTRWRYGYACAPDLVVVNVIVVVIDDGYDRERDDGYHGGRHHRAWPDRVAVTPMSRQRRRAAAR